MIKPGGVNSTFWSALSFIFNTVYSCLLDEDFFPPQIHANITEVNGAIVQGW